MNSFFNNVLQRLGYDLVGEKSVWIFPPRSKPLHKIKDFHLGNPPQWIIGIVVHWLLFFHFDLSLDVVIIRFAIEIKPFLPIVRPIDQTLEVPKGFRF